MKNYIFSFLLIVLGLGISVNAQGLGKIADETFSYVKAGTFGKPKVAKNTSKLSIGQVRVHYKLITSRASVNGKNAADVTVYLDSDLTNGDLQNLTNEFYSMLQQKIRAAGIDFADWKAIEATEYFQERLKEDKKPKDYDGKAGQAWVTFNAFDGPVLLRWKPFGSTELIGFGQVKKMSKASEVTGGDLTTFDVVVDFASIMLNTEIKQDKGFIFYGDPYFHAEYSIGGMMSIPQSYIYMNDRKNGFDQYKIDLPVAERFAFAGKPYKDESKAALKTQNFWSTERHTFTPLVIPATREMYLTAARKVLALYAEMFAEKLKILRAGEKPRDVAQEKPKDDGKTIEQVTAEAKKNNETTPVTTGELLAAAKDAQKAGNTKLALQYLDKAIKDHDSGEALEARMLIRMQAKEFKDAAKDAEAILKKDAMNFQARFSLGTSHFFRADYDKATKILGPLLNDYPNSIETRVNYAMSLLGQKKYDDGLNILNQGLKNHPSSGMLYRGRAAYYKLTGNTAAAQADEIRAAQLGN